MRTFAISCAIAAVVTAGELEEFEQLDEVRVTNEPYRTPKGSQAHQVKKMAHNCSKDKTCMKNVDQMWSTARVFLRRARRRVFPRAMKMMMKCYFNKKCKAKHPGMKTFERCHAKPACKRQMKRAWQCFKHKDCRKLIQSKRMKEQRLRKHQAANRAGNLARKKKVQARQTKVKAAIEVKKAIKKVKKEIKAKKNLKKAVKQMRATDRKATLKAKTMAKKARTEIKKTIVNKPASKKPVAVKAKKQSLSKKAKAAHKAAIVIARKSAIGALRKVASLGPKKKIPCLLQPTHSQVDIVFKAIDSNKDGLLKAHEISAAHNELNKILDLEKYLTKKQLIQVGSLIAANNQRKDGKWTKREARKMIFNLFSEVNKRTQACKKGKPVDVFDMAIRHIRYAAKKDRKKVVKRHTIPCLQTLRKRQVKSIFGKMDTNKDGKLNLGEFRRAIRTFVKQSKFSPDNLTYVLKYVKAFKTERKNRWTLSDISKILKGLFKGINARTKACKTHDKNAPIWLQDKPTRKLVKKN